MSIFEFFSYAVIGIFVFLMIISALSSGNENRHTTDAPPPLPKKEK